MAYGVRFVFRQQWDKSSGWTMQFWNSAGNLALARLRALAMGQTVLDVCGSSVYLHYCRIHNADIPRQAITVNFPPLTGFRPDETDEGLQNKTPYGALLMQCFTTDFQLKAEYEVRGILSKWIKKGGYFGGAGSTTIGALTTALKDPAQGWSLRGKDPARPAQTIKSISEAGVVTLANPLDFTGAATSNGAPLVYLERVLLGTPKRTWKVDPATVGSAALQLLGGSFQARDISVTTASTARPVKYKVDQIVRVDADTITKHDVGGPLDVSTGRRINRIR